MAPSGVTLNELETEGQTECHSDSEVLYHVRSSKAICYN